MAKLNSRRAVTLLELLASSFLAGILLVAVAMAFYYVVRYFQALDARTSLYTQTLQMVHKMGAELNDSAYESVEIAPGSITFASLRDVNNQVPGDELEWRTRRAIFLDSSTQRLSLIRLSLSPQKAIPAPAPLATIQAGGGLNQPLVSGVTNFTATPKAAPVGATPNFITIHIRVEVKGFKRLYWTEADVGCHLRNTGS